MRRRAAVLGIFVAAFGLGLWFWSGEEAPQRAEPRAGVSERERDDLGAAPPRRPRVRSPAHFELPSAPLDGLAPSRSRERGEIACALPSEDVQVGTLRIDGSAREIGVNVTDGVLRFRARAEGSGRLSLNGFAATHIAWADGACVPDPIVLAPMRRWLTGQVAAAGEPGTAVEISCGEARTWSVTGAPFELSLDEGACYAQAVRIDGALRAPGPAVLVAADATGEIPLDLDLPAGKQAGLGLGIRGGEDGVRVQAVHEGVAGAAGVQEGSLILEVDGVSTAGMSSEDFIELATGEEGSAVEIVVEGVDGEVKTYNLVRRPVERPRSPH